jgi:uncharacterized RDD family membrane protein YckC
LSCPRCREALASGQEQCPACGAIVAPRVDGALAPDPHADTPPSRGRGEPLRELPGSRKRERTWKDEVRERVRERRRSRQGEPELPLFRDVEEPPASVEPSGTRPDEPPPDAIATGGPSELGDDVPVVADDLPLRPFEADLAESLVEPAAPMERDEAPHDEAPFFEPEPADLARGPDLLRAPQETVRGKADHLREPADLLRQPAEPGRDLADLARGPETERVVARQPSQRAPRVEPEVDDAEPEVEDEPTWTLDEPTARASEPRPLERPAAWHERLGAAVVDLGVLLLLWGVVVYFTGRAARVPVAGLRPSFGYLAAYLAFLGLAYAAYFTGATGQTLGKLLSGLRVVDTAGQPPGYLRAFVRAALGSAGTLLLLVGVLPIFFDPARRALHDRLFKTRVVRS